MRKGNSEVFFQIDAINNESPLLLCKETMKKAETKINFTKNKIFLFKKWMFNLQVIDIIQYPSVKVMKQINLLRRIQTVFCSQSIIYQKNQIVKDKKKWKNFKSSLLIPMLVRF